MIVTLTMNPSVDRTASIPAALARGGVNRIASVDDVAGGKGVNVARVLHAAAHPVDTVAVVPAPESDPFVAMCREAGVPLRVVPVETAVRVNLTVTEPDGTTTKLNAPGATLDEATLDAITGELTALASAGDWVVLSGSLPAGVPAYLYARLVPRLRAAGVRVAVDTSDEPLRALAAALPGAAPDLIKPNGEELGQIVGVDGAALEDAAAAGDVSAVVDAARELVGRGVGAVLVTLGGAGAVLVTGEGAWRADPIPVEVRSTVGAGDSALAGYLLGEAAGEPPPDRLARAVAHGGVAAGLPGTGLPLGLDMADHPVTVTSLEEAEQ